MLFHPFHFSKNKIRTKNPLRKLTCAALSLLLAGCQNAAALPGALNKNDVYEPVQNVSLTSQQQSSIAQFSLSLLGTLQAEQTGKNILISPASAFLALGMCFDGAGGTTKQAFESAFGMNQTDMNQCASLLTALSQQSASTPFLSANSIWVRTDLSERLSSAWLKTCKSVFDASVYAAKMDEQSIQEMNQWVSEKTDKQIPKMLNNGVKDSSMILLNALCFDGKWEEPYKKEDVWEEDFTDASGSRQKAEMLHGTEYHYLEGAGWKGFIKPFKNQPDSEKDNGSNPAVRYGFAALLPENGTAVEEALESLSGEALADMLTHPTQESITVVFPKFLQESEFNLNESLQNMGLAEAFEESADFSAMTDGENGLFISDVIQKVRLEVQEDGAKGAAATAVVMNESASIQIDPLEVICDRPFLFLIVDLTNGIPIFMGIQNEIPETA